MEIEYSKRYYRYSLLAILFFLLGRVFIATHLELGNDEVYYWLLAKYPALSYFDHPAGLAFFTRLFTLDLFFDSEFTLRLVSLISVTANSFVIFHILKWLNNSKTGFYGVLLYNSSIYVSIITGIFIMPDGLLSFFWITTLFMLFKWNETQKPYYFILAGVFISFAIFTKYHSIFLIIGTGAYLLFHHIKSFKKPYIYISLIIALLGSLPIIIWNVQNDWQSIAFQGNRIGISKDINLIQFAQELFGQIFYNNIVNISIILLAIYHRTKMNLSKSHKYLIYWLSFPLIITFLIASLFKPTLPHWASPGYFPLIIFAAIYLSSLTTKEAKRWLMGSISFILFIYFIGFVEVKHGIINYNSKVKNNYELGKDDFSLDMFGWNQANQIFDSISKLYPHNISKVVDNKWFNAAHIDYYICRPHQLKLIAIGNIEEIHEYQRINQIRGGINQGEDAWFFGFSRHFTNPFLTFNTEFESIEKIGEYPIKKGKKTVEYFHIYILKNYKNNGTN